MNLMTFRLFSTLVLFAFIIDTAAQKTTFKRLPNQKTQLLQFPPIPRNLPKPQNQQRSPSPTKTPKPNHQFHSLYYF